MKFKLLAPEPEPKEILDFEREIGVELVVSEGYETYKMWFEGSDNKCFEVINSTHTYMKTKEGYLEINDAISSFCKNMSGKQVQFNRIPFGYTSTIIRLPNLVHTKFDIVNRHLAPSKEFDYWNRVLEMDRIRKADRPKAEWEVSKTSSKIIKNRITAQSFVVNNLDAAKINRDQMNWYEQGIVDWLNAHEKVVPKIGDKVPISVLTKEQQDLHCNVFKPDYLTVVGINGGAFRLEYYIPAVFRFQFGWAETAAFYTVLDESLYSKLKQL